ncbi:glycosyltransferase [Tropicibacter sp. R16_0]|uniref:glycosyltransferase family 2 protein n=1 Tax=Tropicibacter sp. R16_0 TaxID=2821102 RepID=UPI001ADD43EB|nr:glycosyltransferase [Tropicibacter sp. R16_0]MBO9451657.1 glycosyltransferase [Tropicibacter sp. R16_0]
MNRTISIILPAHNEADYIDACAGALLQSDPLPDGWRAQVIIVANGCTDDTSKRASSHANAAEARGWEWQVIELDQGSKPGALNAGDTAATGDIRVYLDADVLLSPALLPQMIAELDRPEPAYCGGSPVVSRGQSWITRAYGRFWVTLPFVAQGSPGFGVFAMNQAGRARWGDWPQIISDDTFARLNFTPAERIRVAATYHWPLVEGFRNLVRVRRRQNEGVAQIAKLYPELLRNDDKMSMGVSELFQRMLRHPVGFVVYATVALAVKTPLFRTKSDWARGR